MSLLTYEEARPWAKAIKENVVLRNMPPWHIDPNIGISKFKNSVALADQEIATIAQWVDSGAPKGDPADMPRPRKFDDNDKWSIGTPDLIVEMPKDLAIPAKAPDTWKNIIVDTGLTEDVISRPSRLSRRKVSGPFITWGPRSYTRTAARHWSRLMVWGRTATPSRKVQVT